MATEQETQFALHGCASRCLLWLANHKQGAVHMTKAEFIDRYCLDYPSACAKGQCGGTDTGTMLEIAKMLGLANRLQVYRSPSRVRSHIERHETDVILAITEKNDFIHCWIVVGQSKNPARWQFAEVDDSIQTIPPMTVRDSELDLWSAYFCVFFLVGA